MILHPETEKLNEGKTYSLIAPEIELEDAIILYMILGDLSVSFVGDNSIGHLLFQ